ncbi:MAG: hypothetical protein JSS14_18820 [Proteobacteria bacterium]|nr:hypothetical protein [Pseudomonadota bacterium]
MKKLFPLFAIAAFLAMGSAHAADSCDAKAIDKNGKPLAGAAKNSFMKKCQKETAAAVCEPKAVDKNGKALAGAAKNSFMKKCEADAAKG